jgi:hypothetical protein
MASSALEDDRRTGRRHDRRGERMKRVLRRTVLVSALVGALVPAAVAQAGPFTPLHHVTTGGAHFDDGTTALFGLVVTSYTPGPNSHLVTGFVSESGAFAGALYFHTYDRATDTGHYTLDATLANGADIIANAIVQYDRQGAARFISLDGVIAGQPFSTGTLKIT